VLIVVVCSLVVASLASSSGGRTEVLVVTRSVPAGTRVTGADLAATGVSAGPQVRGIRAAAAPSIAGDVATHDLVPGTLLVRSEITSGPPPDPGLAVVGLSVKDGDLPASLAAEDHVEVVSTPATSTGAAGQPSVDAPAVLVADATVRSAGVGPDGQSTLVSLALPVAEAPAVAAANAGGQISLVLIGG
jgi:hypothetical protein